MRRRRRPVFATTKPLRLSRRSRPGYIPAPVKAGLTPVTGELPPFHAAGRSVQSSPGASFGFDEDLLCCAPSIPVQRTRRIPMAVTTGAQPALDPHDFL